MLDLGSWVKNNCILEVCVNFHKENFPDTDRCVMIGFVEYYLSKVHGCVQVHHVTGVF